MSFSKLLFSVFYVLMETIKRFFTGESSDEDSEESDDESQEEKRELLSMDNRTRSVPDNFCEFYKSFLSKHPDMNLYASKQNLYQFVIQYDAKHTISQPLDDVSIDLICETVDFIITEQGKDNMTNVLDNLPLEIVDYLTPQQQ